MRRILSIWLPHFPLERLRRDEPDAVPDGALFALAASEGSRLTVSAATPAALAAGIRTGLGLADARTIAPALLSRPAEPARDAAALARLARWLDRYGPAFNTDGPGGLWVDVTGTGHLHGGEPALLADVTGRLGGLGFTARAAISDGLGAAWALARFLPAADSSTCGEPAGASQAAWLAPSLLAGLPVEALRLEAAATQLLRRLGLKQIGQLYVLPRAALERRFRSKAAAGAVLLRLDQILGLKPEPLRPMRVQPRHAVRAVFQEPLIAGEGLETALAALADSLCAGLEAAHRGARRLRLTLHRTDSSRAVLGAGLSRPGRSPPHLLQLLSGKLDSIDAGFGIDLMQLSATVTEPLAPMQAGLAGGTDSGRTEDETRAALIDRLAGRLGAARVLTLAPRASHLPERAEVFVPALGGGTLLDGQRSRLTEPPAATPPASRQAARPPLLLPAPEPISAVAGLPEDPPELIGWRGRPRRIIRAEGPERIAPEWWREIGATASGTRDYYTVEDDAGTRLWLFRESGRDMSGVREDTARPPLWYVHGIWG